jgi:hypothetical protein
MSNFLIINYLITHYSLLIKIQMISTLPEECNSTFCIKIF